MEITTARILDKRRMLKKSKTYRLAIRITFDRKPIPFPIDLHVSENDFKKLSSPRLGEKLSIIRDKFIEEENRAKDIIRNMGTFTFDAFREEFYKNKITRKRGKSSKNKLPNNQAINTPHILPAPAEGRNKKYGKRKFDRIRSNVNYEELGPLAVAYGEYIKIMEAQERISSSENYFATLISLLRFRKNLRLEDITVLFLHDYERWMIAKGNSLTTVGIYIRTLRAIFNIQIADGLLPAKFYPFGKRKYQIPRGVNIKKALEPFEIKKIYDYQPDPSNKNEGFARDMWIFGYFSNGINPNDIFHLKWKNIDDDFIIIQREKTKFTTRSNPRNILIPINDDMKNIIERWSNQDKDPDNFIFPILTNGLSAHRRRELVQDHTGIINNWMRHIAAKVSITKKVTTLTWRHSYATTLKRSGVSTAFIQESLGHTDMRTTENYLDSFELDIKKKYSHHLAAFKNISDM